jgi:hypothetical protein
MKAFKTKINLGGVEKTVVAFRYKDEENQSTETTTVEQLHHILVIDRSGSMYNEIDGLIDNVKKCIATINEQDLISLIWFSSEGQYRTVIKAAKKFDKLDTILDSLRSTLGCTCFSESLKEINMIIDEIGIAAPISITFFTDGQIVTRHSVDEEKRRCFEELSKMKDKILALNTIGFSNYYDQELLNAFAATSEFGEMFHSSKIDDYTKIFSHNFEKISDAVCEKVEIDTQDGVHVIYLTRSFTKRFDDQCHLSRLDKRKNQFFLVGDGEFSFAVNGQYFETKNIATTPVDATVNNFLYAYAYNMYYEGNRKDSLDILAQNLHDKALIDSHMSAFTFDETAAHLEKLNKAIFNANYRLVDGVAPKNYVPDDDARCLMDVLTFLQGGDSFYIPYSKNVESYSRIGRKASEEVNYFTWTDKEVRVPFGEFVYNKKHMNLSIRICIPGTVQLNPKRAKAVGLDPVIDSCIFRNHTIIKDGCLNLKEIELLLTEKDYTLIEANGIIKQEVGTEVIDGQEFYRCVVKLEGLPVVNRTYIKQCTLDNIFDYSLSIAHLEAKQKIVGYYLDLVEDKSVLKKTGKLQDFTVEQIQVLEEHYLSKELVYSPTKSVASAEECDYYESRTMEFVLAGCTSWPKVSELFERRENGKKMTTALTIMNEEFEKIERGASSKKILLENVNAKLRDYFLDLQKSVKNDLIQKRAFLGNLKIAKLLTGDWFDGLSVDDKGKYYFEKDGLKMNVTASKTKEYY